MNDTDDLERAWGAASMFRLGLYEHHKGGRYSAIAIVTHHETRMPMVLYVSHTYGGTNVRPLVGWEGDKDGFDDMVLVDKGTTNTRYARRFSYVGPLPSNTPLADR